MDWDMFESDMEREFEREEYYLSLEQEILESQLMEEAY